MNITKILGISSSLLGLIVFIVAAYLSISSESLVLEPFVLGIAGILVGVLCVKKSRD